jgi:hypothetical protein
MDYGTIAQLSNPGQNPIAGPGIADIEAYSNYRNLANMRQESLKAAMPLAALDAQQKAQQNKEFMLGAPGREAQAQDSLRTYNRDRFTKDLEHMAKNTELRNKIIESTENIAQDADAYFNGDEKVRKAIIEQNRGKVMVNGYRIGDDPIKDDQLFTARGAMRAYNPTLANKERIQGMKGVNALDVANVKGGWANATSAERNATMLAVEQMRQQANAAKAANKPLSADQQLFEYVKRLAGNDDEAVYALWSQYKAAQTQAKLENEAEFLKKYNIKGPTSAPAHAPIVPGGGMVNKADTKTEETKPETKSQYKIGTIYTDKNGVKAKWTEKGWQVIRENQ